jgi:hypothetical protein
MAGSTACPHPPKVADGRLPDSGSSGRFGPACLAGMTSKIGQEPRTLSRQHSDRCPSSRQLDSSGERGFGETDEPHAVVAGFRVGGGLERDAESCRDETLARLMPRAS